MNKSELASEVAKKTGLTKSASLGAIDATFESIAGAMKNGDEVRLIGFGSFTTLHRKAGTGRNPRTRETLSYPASTIPKFRHSRVLKESLNT